MLCLTSTSSIQMVLSGRRKRRDGYPHTPIFTLLQIWQTLFLYGPKVCLTVHESEQTPGKRAPEHAAVHRVTKHHKGFGAEQQQQQKFLSSGPWLKFSMDSRNSVYLFFPSGLDVMYFLLSKWYHLCLCPPFQNYALQFQNPCWSHKSLLKPLQTDPSFISFFN